MLSQINSGGTPDGQSHIEMLKELQALRNKQKQYDEEIDTLRQ